jgi:hypothetical protein
LSSRSRKSGRIERVGKVAADSALNVDERVGAHPGSAARPSRKVHRHRPGCVRIDRTVKPVAAIQPVVAGKPLQAVIAVQAKDRVDLARAGVVAIMVARLRVR